jgi:hypothetical protein
VSIRSNIRRLGSRIAQPFATRPPVPPPPAPPETDAAPVTLDLLGDRDVEWGWIAATLPSNPGRVLDFGPATSYLGLSAALAGGDVLGIDITPEPVPFRHPRLRVVSGDLTSYDFGGQRFDTILNCSTTEHVGLAGRYGSRDDPDGDLKAMAILHRLMAGPDARMLFTIPVGVDMVAAPFHRIYGVERLPRLLQGYRIERETYVAKLPGDNRWQPVDKPVALSVQGSASFYALGLFVLRTA